MYPLHGQGLRMVFHIACKHIDTGNQETMDLKVVIC